MNHGRHTILLIHGYGFDTRIWSPVELGFEGFDVLYFSLPGFGDDSFREGYSIEELSKYYWDRLGALGDRRVHLVGHSMGGYVCMEMIAQHPERVLSLGLIHSHVFEDTPDRKGGRSSVLEEIKSTGHNSFVERMISSLIGSGISDAGTLVSLLISRGRSYSDTAWYNGTRAIRDRRDHGNTLLGIRIPVLMIMGAEDKAVPIEFAYKQAALCERCHLHIYPGVGHLAMYEHTAAMIADLHRFFSPFLY